MQLTDEQQRIIEHHQGHAKVIAVAGAGKTSTLSLFIRQRLISGQNPRRMLVIMYNKSAQKEFDQKLRGVVRDAGLGSTLPQVRTFHSLGLKIYQGLIRDGILPAFEGDLLGQGETEAMLWHLMQKAAPSKNIAKDILEQKKKWVEPMMSYMDRVKAELDPPSVVYENMDLPKQCDFFPTVFERFENWRKQNRRISYNDMLFDPCQLFSKRPDVAAHFANHMDWILVDEYQDINPIQQFLLQTLAGQRSSVVVIGDPDQTIYEFRGSRPAFMQRIFDEQFQPLTTYTLSQTFRYGHRISLMSNQLIQHNQHRQPVLCISHPNNPDTIVKQYQSDDTGMMVRQLVEHKLKTTNASDIAILNRLWGISAPIELAFLEANIPYRLDHPGSVLERMELQPFMLLLEMSTGVFQDKSVRQRQQDWLTLLTLPYLKIKRSLLEQVAYMMGQCDGQFAQFFSQQTFSDLSQWQLQQVETRIELASLAQGNRIKAHQLMNRHIRETDFYKGLSESAFSKQQVDDRVATVQAFVRFAAKLDLTPANLYEHLQLLKQQKKEQSKQTEAVLISSIHKAKGLEWPVVIIPSVTEYYYPYQAEGELSTQASEESERRLLYVAMTRAKQELHFIVPPVEGSTQEASPFVGESYWQEMHQLASAINSTSGETVEIPTQAEKISREYLKAVKGEVILALRRPQKPSFKTSRVKKSNVPSETMQKIRHGKFGLGHIQREDDRYFHIVFGDGQLRVLDKSIAGPAIEYL